MPRCKYRAGPIGKTTQGISVRNDGCEHGEEAYSGKQYSKQ